MDFQPRLGVITKAIWRASSDLFYFLIVAALVFLFYAMFAHIILGDALKVWMVHAVIVCVGPHTAVILWLPHCSVGCYPTESGHASVPQGYLIVPTLWSQIIFSLSHCECLKSDLVLCPFLSHKEFRTFGSSLNTCFVLLLGNLSCFDSIRALGGKQAVIGTIFFWTYMLFVFMVLFNFLLAIIVDAFSQVAIISFTRLFYLLYRRWK